MFRLIPVVAAVLAFASSLLAFDPDIALIESIPDGVEPKTAQREWANAIAGQVYRCQVTYDGDGEIENLHISNHGVDVPSGVSDKDAYQKARQGPEDELFMQAQYLPGLKRLRILKLPLSETALTTVIEGQQDLRVLGVEYHEGDDSGSFMRAIAGMDQLEWLELKHLFQLGGTTVAEIGHLPKLVRLELDNASAQSEALPLLKANPQVIDFELHRSGWTNEQIAEAVSYLPNLRRFAIKPAGRAFDAGCFAAIAELDDLEVLALWSFRDDAIFWEGGVEHLEGIDTLEHIEVNGGLRNHPAMQRLKEVREDLEIDVGKHVIAAFD
ncbi:MAG: hypothetical protein ACFB21_04880, partial [Opitutales bacterium]